MSSLRCSHLRTFVDNFKNVVKEIYDMIQKKLKRILVACSAGHNRSVLALAFVAMAQMETYNIMDTINIMKMVYNSVRETTPALFACSS